MLNKIFLMVLIVVNVSMAKVKITTRDANGREIEIEQPARDEVDEMIDEVLKAHNFTVDNLISQLKDPNLPNMTKVRSIYALGELRANAATTDLIMNINLVAERIDSAFSPSLHLPRWGAYPAREALIKIGSPASEMTIKIIGSHKFAETAIDGYAAVLAGVEGQKALCALMELEDHLMQTKDENIRKRYEAVMDSIKALVPPGETPQTISADSQQQGSKSGPVANSRLPSVAYIIIGAVSGMLILGLILKLKRKSNTA